MKRTIKDSRYVTKLESTADKEYIYLGMYIVFKIEELLTMERIALLVPPAKKVYVNIPVKK
jgi:hypothetical protein